MNSEWGPWLFYFWKFCLVSDAISEILVISYPKWNVSCSVVLDVWIFTMLHRCTWVPSVTKYMEFPYGFWYVCEVKKYKEHVLLCLVCPGIITCIYYQEHPVDCSTSLPYIGNISVKCAVVSLGLTMQATHVFLFAFFSWTANVITGLHLHQLWMQILHKTCKC